MIKVQNLSSSICQLLDQTAGRPGSPITIAVGTFDWPHDLEMSDAEQQALRLIRAVRIDSRTLLPLPEAFQPSDPHGTLDMFGADVVAVLDRWAQGCCQLELQAFLGHLSVAIRREQRGMSRQLVEDVNATINRYVDAATQRAESDYQNCHESINPLAYTVPVTQMLSAAARLMVDTGQWKRLEDLSELVLRTCHSHVSEDDADGIGYVLSLLDVLNIVSKKTTVDVRGRARQILSDADQLCRGRPQHRLVLETLLDQPGLTTAEKSDIRGSIVDVMRKDALDRPPNEAMPRLMEVVDYCRRYSQELGDHGAQQRAELAITRNAPDIQLESLPVDIPDRIGSALRHEIRNRVQVVNTSRTLKNALRVITDEPAPLPDPREPSDIEGKGLVRLPECVLDRRKLPVKHIPQQLVPSEKRQRARVSIMMLRAEIAAAQLDAIGQRFKPSINDIEQVLPELHVTPENRYRFAAALCRYWENTSVGFDSSLETASVKLEGYLLEVAACLDVPYFTPPSLNSSKSSVGTYRNLPQLIEKLKPQEEIDDRWIETIEYVGSHQGLGLNKRNEVSHALNAFGDRKTTALALKCLLYLSNFLDGQPSSHHNESRS